MYVLATVIQVMSPEFIPQICIKQIRKIKQF